MKAFTGDAVTGDFHELTNCQRISFSPDGGRIMFEVCVGKDGRSLEVRAVNTCKVDGVVYDTRIQVMPWATNCVTIQTMEYKS